MSRPLASVKSRFPVKAASVSSRYSARRPGPPPSWIFCACWSCNFIDPSKNSIVNRWVMEAETHNIASEEPMSAKVNVTTILNLRVFMASPLFRCKDVPNATKGMKERPPIPLKFLAQMADMHVDRRTRIRTAFPLIEDGGNLVPRYRASRGAHQQLENVISISVKTIEIGRAHV